MPTFRNAATYVTVVLGCHWQTIWFTFRSSVHQVTGWLRITCIHIRKGTFYAVFRTYHGIMLNCSLSNVCRRWICSKVIVRTYKHTSSTDCSTGTTKVVGMIKTDLLRKSHSISSLSVDTRLSLMLGVDMVSPSDCKTDEDCVANLVNAALAFSSAFAVNFVTLFGQSTCLSMRLTIPLHSVPKC